MWRLIIFLALLAGAAFGLSWLVDKPGQISIVWLEHRIETSMPVALGFVLLAAIALSAWLNLFIKIRYPSSLRLQGRTAALLLAYDVLQLSVLLSL